MSAEIRVPTLGESIVDATIASWLKKEGDAVRQGDALVELETDKVNVEVNAEQEGVLQKVVKQQGDTVAVGEVLGLIGTGAGENESSAASTNGASAASNSAVEPTISSPPHTPPADAEMPTPPTSPLPQPAVQEQRVAAQQSQQPAQEQRAVAQQPIQRQATGELQRPPSPLARRIAAEHNVDISQVQGTSPHGRVTRDDVVSYLEQSSQKGPASSASSTPVVPPQQSTPVISPAQAQRVAGNGAASPTLPTPPAPPASTQSALPVPPPAPSAPQGREERVRMSRRRQTIAQRLVEAQHNAAMLTTFNEVDMTAIMDVRSRRKDAFKERNGVSLGFMSFFTKAVIGALKSFPRLNAEIQGNEFILKHYYDIGIAVGAEEGLVVPVLRNADSKSFAAIEREIAELAKRARENKLSLSELQGGTFTITNGGVFGSLLSTPILNAPQVGILGMHKIEQRPIALNGQVVIRPMMYLAVSYDHRIVDGSEAVRFLVRVKELLEDPETLLLEG